MKPLPALLTTSGWSAAKKRAKYDQDTGLRDLLKKVDSAYKAVDWNFCDNPKNVIAIKDSPAALRKKIDAINKAKLALEDALGAVLDDSRKVWQKIKEDIAIKDVLEDVWAEANAFRIAVRADKSTERLEGQIDAFQQQASDLAARRVKAKKALGEIIKGNLDGADTGSVQALLNPLRDYNISIMALQKLTPGAYPPDFVKIAAIWGGSNSPLYSLKGLAPAKQPAAREKLIKTAIAYVHAINEHDPITKG